MKESTKQFFFKGKKMYHTVSFGKTLELTTVGEDGKITSQVLTSTGPDCHISFKMDKGSFLTPDLLRETARSIESQMQNSGLTLASEVQHNGFMQAAKDSKVSEFFGDSLPVLVMAELLANQKGLTLYEERVSNALKGTLETLNEIIEEEQYDEDEEEDWDDEEDDWDDENKDSWTFIDDWDDEDDDDDFEDDDDDEEEKLL